ncbi:hypothetical protein E2P42_00615 [Candidatus Bathyarchaeota archaeon]|nr:hypothetical protein E2P42_00615 [Candidatus Bathyarchaeota archaeon]
MGSRVGKKGTSLMDAELRGSLPKQPVDERLAEMAETVSFRDIPLEERRKEANKPLFLDRYE